MGFSFLLFIPTALFFQWNAIPIIPCVFFCQHSPVEWGQASLCVNVQESVWKAIRLCTCVKCGQVCGGVLIYFVMFVMCVLTDLKVLHHTAVLMCLFLLLAFTGDILWIQSTSFYHFPPFGYFFKFPFDTLTLSVFPYCGTLWNVFVGLG